MIFPAKLYLKHYFKGDSGFLRATKNNLKKKIIKIHWEMGYLEQIYDTVYKSMDFMQVAQAQFKNGWKSMELSQIVGLYKGDSEPFWKENRKFDVYIVTL